MKELLKFEKINISYEKRQVLYDLSFSLNSGEILGVVGNSGCGKSTLLKSIMGLSGPKVLTGNIFFENLDLLSLNASEMRRIRGNRISMVFQESGIHTNPLKTIGDTVFESMKAHRQISKEEAKNRVIEIFNEVGIPEAEKRFNSYPHELSGGLRQRVMIGMAMICKPKLLIADEPTTALDVTIEAQILKLMKKLCESVGTSIIMITHNMGVVAEICDYVYVMYAGRVVESTLTKTLFNETAHPYTNGLLKSIPTIGKKQDRLYTIKGNVPNILNLPKGCRFVDRCDYAQDICFSSRPADEYIKDNHMVSCFLHKRIEDEKCSIKFKKHS